MIVLRALVWYAAIFSFAYSVYFHLSDQQLPEGILSDGPLPAWDSGVSFKSVRVDPTLELSVAMAGPEDAERVIIFVHGFPDMKVSWKPHVGYFANRGYRVMAFDTRGNGGSQPTGDGGYLSLDMVIRDITGLIDATNCQGKEVYLVCHDWGAVPAWGVAVNAPTKITGLISYSVPHPHLYMTYNLETMPMALRKIWYFLYWGATTPLGLWKSQRNDFGWFKSFIWGTSEPGTFSRAEVDELVDNMRARDDQMFSWYQMGFRWMVEFLLPVESPFGTVWSGPRPAKVPVLQLFGAGDAYISQEMAIPGVRSEYIPAGSHTIMYDASHWLPHERPLETCRDISHWIESR
eukprot:CAMPEP_0119126088 /NCGR_PEP_ID=MMETSP1310-20130426/5143_1 /TAXON_ID=464262 /ORGANISM="Genus nov. species nov., Strain RCC2339" /LENGTH=347 /DNA_ID=CAMNT_0007116221 /DNA_START=67 /DNA_END=1110 /DNA_ORIENTATION=-